MRKRRVVSITLLMALLIVLLPVLASAAERRPNILLICVDDLRPDLGCYGAPHVKSPNIDKLSASGVTFDRCYVQVAVCNPSRASLLTGLRPNTLQCWTLAFHFRETKPEAITLPQYLRQHGYHAEGYGKVFHNPWQDPRSWSVPHQFGQGSYTHYDEQQQAFIEQVRKSLPDGAWQKPALRGPITNAPEIRDEEHPDGDMARLVCKRLAVLKEAEQPFFLAAGFILPHLPWSPPKRYWDLYDRDQVPLAKNPEIPVDTPTVALGTNYEFSHYADSVDFPTPTEGKVTELNARRYIHGYLAAITFVDTQIGLILEALQREGLAENTIVVLWSDHGYKLGEHNGWGKMTNFEIDTRIPLIIRDPRAKANGQRSSRLIETLDVFPTLCELAGVPAPEFAEGRSAANLLDDPRAEHIQAACSQYVYPPLIGNSIRTSEWRYTEWRQLSDGAVQQRELYDHRTEHGENRNVIGQHPAVEEQMQKQLAALLPARRLTLLPQIRSAEGGEKVSVRLVNRHAGTVRISWINPRGQRTQVFDLEQGKDRTVNSFSGHVFAAESLDGRYHELITVAKGAESFELGTVRDKTPRK